MKNTRSRFLPAIRVAAAASLAAALSACGEGGGGNAPTPVATPPPPTPPPPQLLFQSSGPIGPESALVTRPFTTTQRGTFEILLDWTFARNDLDVALASGTCNTEDDVNSGRCALVALTQSTTAKPERLNVPGQPPGTYYVFIVNWSGEQESANLQVVFAASSASSGVAASSTRTWPARWRALRFAR